MRNDGFARRQIGKKHLGLRADDSSAGSPSLAHLLVIKSTFLIYNH